MKATQSSGNGARTVEGKEKVILIHGTFASSGDDWGDAWWQAGSTTRDELQRRLPSTASLAPDRELFRWSGENNERARSKAAVELLDYLAPFEAEGRPYHLIGHSHGGSVIWAALRLATVRRRPLGHLRSWSTVGTPFLHHRSRSPWNFVNIAYMLLAAMLLVPAVRTFSMLAGLPYNLATGNLDNGIVIRHSEDAGFVSSILRAPVLELLNLCGVTFSETAGGIRVGSYSPDSGQSVAEFLLLSSEGWLILGAIVVFGYITLLLGSWCVSPVLESIRIRWEQRLEQRAFENYASRWLGIWTPDDEAINGLRATLELSVSFLGKLVPRERIFVSDAISLFSRPCYWILAPLYNTLLRPVLDTAIRRVVVRAAQGNNRPAAQVAAVAPCPVLPPDAPAVPPLPESVRTKILAEADRHAGDLGPKIRQLLAQPSFTAGLDKFSKNLTGRELVHTSYFDHAEVIDLLAENIHWSQDEAKSHCASNRPDLMKWFAGFKRLLVAGDLPRKTASSPGDEGSTVRTTRDAA